MRVVDRVEGRDAKRRVPFLEQRVPGQFSVADADLVRARNSRLFGHIAVVTAAACGHHECDQAEGDQSA